MTAARWALWFAACLGVGVGLGLASLPSGAGAAPDASPAREVRLREAGRARAVVPAPTAPPVALIREASPRRGARLGADARRARPPRIAVVIDDLGLDRRAFERVNALPGPLTLAFLPYGANAQGMVDDVRPVHEAILHLPTEPVARLEDAGPDMLRVGEPDAIRASLDANLVKLSGYAGVNNHTGSRFTGDAGAMRTLLSALDERGLYFLDSVTTPRPVASALGRAGGWRVVERDVFLDDDYDGGEAAVRAQLALAERIARVHGEAVVIGHPYRATVRALGPWLVTAQARGFELVTVGELAGEAGPPLVAGLR